MTISLDRLEALAKAATPGPWHIHEDEPRLIDSSESGFVVCDELGFDNGKTLRYIAACDPGTVIKLIAVAQAMRAIHDEIDKKVDDDGVDGLSADWLDTINSVMALMEDSLSALESP